MLQQLRRQDLILLIGLFSLAIVAVIVVSILILRQNSLLKKAHATPPAASKPSYVLPNQTITGLNLYNLYAKKAALGWANDAQLIAASAKWSNVLSIQQVGEPTTWSYHFYSPTQRRKLFVNVDPDGQTQIFPHPVEVTLPPQIITSDSWLTDSPTALATWLDNGGNTVLQDNLGLDLVIQLRQSRKLAHPTWVIVGLNESTHTTYTVLVDAAQGWVVQ